MANICDSAMPRAKTQPPRHQVYWWSPEIAEMRVGCVVVRRRYTRYRRLAITTRDPEEEARLYKCYREAKKALQKKISEAKEAGRKELLESLNRDPWGKPYRVVRGKLRLWAPPLTQSLQPQFVERVVSFLFPDGAEHTPPPMSTSVAEDEVEVNVPEITEAEFAAAELRLRAKNTAPGPDGIPGRALAIALPFLGPRLRSMYDACLEHGTYPTAWKTGKLVLLKKEGRPAESPSAYRPIVLLDEIGKLFERIIAARIIEHMNRVGPNLSDNQYGFRVGRSTVDAILRVKEFTEEVVKGGEVALAVSLDIANAFNTLPWSCVMEALKYHQVPLYLRRIIGAYLDARSIIYPGRDRRCERQVTCGVPQGSVLGPLLWNIGYDWVLRGSNLPGVSLTCYADDTLVLSHEKTYRDAARLAAMGVAQIVNRIRLLGLEVALSKSEAICFHGPRRAPPVGSHIVISGVQIQIQSTMRYLGLVLDSRWNFNAHFQRLVTRVMGAAGALGRLLPNLGGANNYCRRLYMGVIRSMALYGAPVWAYDITARGATLLRKPQRVIAIRAIRGYRTISGEAACALAGSLPWDLDAKLLASLYIWRKEVGTQVPARVVKYRLNQLRDEVMAEWKQRLLRPGAGLRTIEALQPALTEWIERRHGVLTFRLTQVLAGHGCFGKYLCHIAGREPTPSCHHCSSGEDTAQHTIELCPAWVEQRNTLVAEVGSDLSLPSIIKSMVGSERSWQAVAAFAEKVMAMKEAAEREREMSSALPIRVRRSVHRRRADNALFRPP